MGLFFNLEKLDMQHTIKRQNETIKALNEKISELQKTFSSEYNCPVSVDFESLNVFSIERNPGVGSNSYPRTILGYKDADSVNREWYFYCSASVHEKLVKEFNEYIIKKNNKTAE